MEKGVTVSYDTAPVLFTPDGAQAQYAICSPIADRYGTIYFKNDSGYLMAVGSTIEKLEITTLPDKTEYTEGEIFDPTGMTVTATFSNGIVRDVTDYVSYSAEPLTLDDTDFFISYEYVMYQNKDGEAGVEYTAPNQVLSLTISAASEMKGDVNQDGKVNLMDVSYLFRLYTGEIENTLSLTDLDIYSDGEFTLRDVTELYSLVSGIGAA